MGKMNFMRNFLFLQGFLIFIIHFIFSPYPLNSINRFKKAMESYLKECRIKNKIIRKKFVVDENGYNFKIFSFGSKAIDPYYSYFIFIAEKCKIQNYENGLYVVSIPDENPAYFRVKSFNLNEDDLEFIHYIENEIPDSSLIVLSFSGFIFNKENINLGHVFKKIGAGNYKKAREGCSYIMITKKEGKNFSPVKEVFSDRKILFVDLKIKP